MLKVKRRSAAIPVPDRGRRKRLGLHRGGLDRRKGRKGAIAGEDDGNTAPPLPDRVRFLNS